MSPGKKESSDRRGEVSLLWLGFLDGTRPAEEGGCSEQVSAPRIVKTSGRTAARTPRGGSGSGKLAHLLARPRPGVTLGLPAAGVAQLPPLPSRTTSLPAPADTPHHPRCWLTLVELWLPRTARALRTSSPPAARCQSCPRTPAGPRPRRAPADSESILGFCRRWSPPGEASARSEPTGPRARGG